jgi:AP-4 complex subunit epsilon-1
VRKKAVMVFERFYSRAPTMVSHLSESFRRALLDKDPSVMGAALCLYHRIILVRTCARQRRSFSHTSTNTHTYI